MPNNCTLTDQAAIILKSYGCDDVEAARAVVALVLGELRDAVDVADSLELAQYGTAKISARIAARDAKP